MRNPWRAHGAILAAMAIGYGVLAVSAWPSSHRQPSGGKLEEGLSVLVAIGEGAAAASIVFAGACVLMYAAISTAVLGAVPHHRRDPWLVHGALLALVAIAALVMSRS